MLRDLLARFKPALPPVDIGPQTRGAIEARLAWVGPGDAEGVADALYEIVEGVLWEASEAWRQACGVPESELACELYLVAFAAFAEAGGEAGPPMAALRERVAYGLRERFDEGPAPLLATARGFAEERAIGHVVVGMVGRRLELTARRGGAEGWFALGLAAWIAGDEAMRIEG